MHSSWTGRVRLGGGGQSERGSSVIVPTIKKKRKEIWIRTVKEQIHSPPPCPTSLALPHTHTHTHTHNDSLCVNIID